MQESMSGAPDHMPFYLYLACLDMHILTMTVAAAAGV